MLTPMSAPLVKYVSDDGLLGAHTAHNSWFFHLKGVPVGIAIDVLSAVMLGLSET